jgi:hypothetical protein
MRPLILTVLALTLASAAVSSAGDKNDTPPSKDSYVKVRVEVEVRGILRDSDKGVMVTARDRLYNRFNDAEELTDEGRPTTYTLDFARASDQRALAKALDGKEVVVIGLGELRMVNQKVRPGGFTGGGPFPQIPTPTWSLQRTVLVTGLKSVAQK